MTVKLLAVAAMAAASLTAQAAPVITSTSPFTGTMITFNDFDGFETSGTVNLGQGVTLNTTGNVVLGQNAYNLEDNGAWTGFANSPDRDGHFLSTAFPSGGGQISFTFAMSAVSVGAFVNQFQPSGQTNNSLLAVAYDVNGNVLESFTVSPNTAADGYDEGIFIGFHRAQGDIRGFGLVNGSFVVDNLTVTAVPEPSSLVLTLGGLFAVGALARRRAR